MAASQHCLLVTGSLDVGGMDEVVAVLAQRLPRHGLRTTVLHTAARGALTAGPGRLARALVSRGVEVVETEAPAPALLAELRPDVISAHGAAAWVLDAAQAARVPVVDTLHGMHDLLHVDHAIEARRSEALSAVVAVSELVREQYLAVNPAFPPARVVTVPNGFDPRGRRPVEREQARAWLGLTDEVLLVSLGRCCLQKNALGLLRAFAETAEKHPEAHLLVAGRPDDPLYTRDVRRLRDDLPCRDRVHLRDHCPDPQALLAAADGFVLASFFEGWPLASMEALCAGVPVVLTDVGGAHDQVGVGGLRGVVVPNALGRPECATWPAMARARDAVQDNQHALALAMSGLCLDREHWRSVRADLAEESRARFSLEECLRGHASVLAQAAVRGVLVGTQ